MGQESKREQQTDRFKVAGNGNGIPHHNPGASGNVGAFHSQQKDGMKEWSRKLWEHPWRYGEGFLLSGGMALVGLLLQLLFGNIEPSWFAFPINSLLGGVFVALLLLLHLFFHKTQTLRWFSSVYATIPALTILLAAVVVMGVIPQLPNQTAEGSLPVNPFTRTGWQRMTTSRMFLLLCFHFLAILGFVVLKRTTERRSWQDIGFYLNHIGLFVVLLGGILGSADMERVTMSVKEKSVEWRGRNDAGEIKELPVAIQLDTFCIEEYPPKLVVIDKHSGKILPEERPETYLFEGVGKTARLAGTRIEILDYTAQAAMVADSHFVNFVPHPMQGAATAIRVRVTKPSLAEPVEGWVSNGSYLFPHNVLYLDEKTAVAMPLAEVKKYSSKVTVFTKAGDTKHAEIEVNRPLSIEDWIVYQYGYDESMGKYSDTSIFELVRDPWLKVVYAGMGMLLAGALYLFVTGPNKKKSV